MVGIRDLHNRSVGAFVSSVVDIGAQAWSATTPCEGWSVRDLVNHVVGEELWAPPLLAGQTIADVGARFDGDVLGAQPVVVAQAAAADVVEAVERVDLEQTVHLSFGDFPAAFYLEQLFADHVVHTWDLCVAAGLPYPVDGDLVDACIAWFEGQEEAYRAAGVIGERPARLPAGGLDRLLVMFGRDPGWRP
jgi:uncharacterized protein (TIGR03086 family)